MHLKTNKVSWKHGPGGTPNHWFWIPNGPSGEPWGRPGSKALKNHPGITFWGAHLESFWTQQNELKLIWISMNLQVPSLSTLGWSRGSILHQIRHQIDTLVDSWKAMFYNSKTSLLHVSRIPFPYLISCMGWACVRHHFLDILSVDFDPKLPPNGF